MLTKPTKLKPFKHKPVPPLVRDRNHVENRQAKQQKLDLLNDLIKDLENRDPVDFDYLRGVKRRRNATRNQLHVMRP